MKKIIPTLVILLFVKLLFSQSNPVVIADTGQGYCGDVVIVDVLSNDYDPEGAELEIKDVVMDFPVPFDSSFLVISDPYIEIRMDFEDGLIINSDLVKLRYRVQEVDNPESYSDWGEVNINMVQNPNAPIFNRDYANVVAGYPTTIDIFANDDLAGYSVEIADKWNDSGYFNFNDGTNLIFTSISSLSGTVVSNYFSQGDGFLSFGEIEIEVYPIKLHDSVNINNVNAGINSDGFLFSRVNEIVGFDVQSMNPHFEFPNGSGKHTIYSGALWIGGIDQDDSLHLAAQRYKQAGYDYQFGPVSDSYEGLDFYRKWNRVWKLSKDEISYHRNNYWKEDYVPIDAIVNWPANGDVNNGQSVKLAPFFDSNDNGIYEPMSGDYPLIRGDQSVFVIFNDDRNHTETDGKKLKVEVHGMLYSFAETDNSVLNNSVFMHYDIYNRSENTYYNTYIGSFTDIDIGFSRDDYVGCNVGLGSYFGYNGYDIDGNGEPEAYGENPPAQSISVIAGPFIDDDNLDNPNGGCDYSINGLNFGDQIVDNERYGLTGFIYFNNGGLPATSDPRYASDYYNYLRGLWKDGTNMLYGGTAHVSGPGVVGPSCKFMWPGDSDPCNWGTGGVVPNGGYNQDGKYWSEETANNGNPNLPNDRRAMGATGPFTFEPGERQELDLAYMASISDNDSLTSIQQLGGDLSELSELVAQGNIITPADYLDIDEHDTDCFQIRIFPNPACDFLYIDIASADDESMEFIVANSYGEIFNTGTLKNNGNAIISVNSLPAGLYFLRIASGNSIHSFKFIKIIP